MGRLNAVGADANNSRVVMMGHSMGGLIAATHIIERQPTIAGLLMSNPAIAFAVPLMRPVGKRKENTMNSIQWNRRKKWTSLNQLVVKNGAMN